MLGAREVHLWLCWPDRVSDAELLSRYRALLAPDERERHARYRSAEGRHEYLLTRALVRTVLSRYAPVEPQAWRFSSNEHGRPEIAGPTERTGLRFNVSHTHCLVACAVARRRNVGIDVEDTTRGGQTVALADRFFSRSEAAALRALPAAMRRDRFFAYWTLKESYIKARGMGLAIPLADFSFELRGGRGIRVTFAPRLAAQDRASRWQFALLRPSKEHRLAIAVERRGSEPVRIVARDVVPLRT